MLFFVRQSENVSRMSNCVVCVVLYIKCFAGIHSNTCNFFCDFYFVFVSTELLLFLFKKRKKDLTLDPICFSLDFLILITIIHSFEMNLFFCLLVFPVFLFVGFFCFFVLFLFCAAQKNIFFVINK